MRYGYSFSTGGLYDSFVSLKMPDDIIYLTDDEFEKLKEGINSGGVIEKGVDGKPFITELPPISKDEENWEKYKETAKTELENTSKTMERIIEAVSLGTTKLDAPDVVAFMLARKARRDVLSQSSGDPSLVLPALVYPSGT